MMYTVIKCQQTSDPCPMPTQSRMASGSRNETTSFVSLVRTKDGVTCPLSRAYTPLGGSRIYYIYLSFHHGKGRGHLVYPRIRIYECKPSVASRPASRLRHRSTGNTTRTKHQFTWLVGGATSLYAFLQYCQ